MLATSNGSEVSTILVSPDDAFALMVFGPGSATPIHRPLMVQMAEALAHQGIATFRYNYPYSERETVCSSDPIDSLNVLLATARSARDAARALSLDLPLFLGGRSMSGQVLSLALAREDWRDVQGAVLYVYPTRWRVLLDDTVGHLQRVPAPMLFVQGGCDEEFANLDELQSLLNRPGTHADLHVIEGADHSYDLPPGTGKTKSDTLAEVASVTAAWMRKQPQERGNPTRPP